MKRILLIVLVLVAAAWDGANSAQVLGVNFGTVQQGAGATGTFELDAGVFTLTADTPFDVVGSTSPFTVSPLSGTLRRIKNTVFTVKVPANTAPGAYDQKIKIVVHRNNGDVTVEPLVRATVLGFPFDINPDDFLDLGNVSTGSISLKHIGGTPESYTVSSRETFSPSIRKADIRPGQTHVINLSPGQGFPSSGTAEDTVVITHDRTGENRNIRVTGKVGGKSDLVSTIFAVKVFPRAAGETKTNIQVSYKIQNIGFVETKACAGKITLDNDKVLDIAVPQLFPGQSIQDGTTTKLFSTQLTGNQKVKVVLDIDDKNDELLENNNVGIQDITIP